MKILVCIKQVADLESRFQVASGQTWFNETDLAFRLNEYDEFAVEAAVQLKEQTGGDLTVISVGPARASEALKKALAMGADQAVHVLEDQQLESFQTAQVIFEQIKAQGYDLIFTGMQSSDKGSGQVGLLLGEMLKINSVSCVVAFKYDGRIEVERELEGGLRAKLKLATPALVTCQLGLNQPRYPTLPNIMKAKKKPKSEVTSPAPASRLQVVALGPPPKAGAAELIEGDLLAQVSKVVAILKEHKLA
ncbi:MAG: electron transfer flavoprotein subunit beta [Candidatus Lambdaproteobacteria bacterium RIFOXYD2_FULL_50_16]|uniref:Electron transfer flavoprotein subunit beta n=1 Tax=Candidatus Lambdaproteobacteria bacterium RIFOXYD2_FULL_50_16 TaxID=1817772 RepID=A0A1F6G8N8_9PROT|nr:MAG: electron transfer flavoprotein subunit beta [Candidatus Lambdaproteobacteria bacterium RIFOXYD2_FULL_50_16]